MTAHSNLSRLSLFVVVVLSCTTCNKHLSNIASDKAALLHTAQSYIDSISTAGLPVNYRAAQPKKIRWDLAQSASNQGLLVPIVYENALLMKANFAGNDRFHIDYLTQLLFYQDSTGHNTAQVITAFPDSNYFKDPTRPFTGIQFVEDWFGHPLQKYLHAPDGTILRYTPNNKQPDAVTVTTTCYTISGYNYSPASNEVYTWTEDAGCSINFAEDRSNGSGGGGAPGPPSGSGSGTGTGTGAGTGTHSPAAAFTVLPGTSVIKSIKTYFQCFTNVGGSDHTYTITVCVDQPAPGSRTPWTTSGSGSSGSSASNNPVDVGHTFLLLTETYNGTTITRNVGFYPADNVSPLQVTSQGALNDDETSTYNISGSFNVTNAQFFNILNFISQGNTAGYLYNLNTNNCTTFVLNAVAQAGINLPRTTGTWPNGAGTDPGDLGEDIRNNNIPGMTLNLAGGSATSHYNVGQCN